MPAAYQYAAGRGPCPAEYTLSAAIRKYGAQAVLGTSQLSAIQIRSMQAAENIIDGYRSQHAAKDRAAWNRTHPQMANLLAQCAIAVIHGSD